MIMKPLDFSDYIIKHATKHTFIGENSCRAASYLAQAGRCHVTGQPLTAGNRQMHHRTPRCCGGTDRADNTLVVLADVHLLIHSHNPETVAALRQKLNLTDAQERMIDELRLEARERPLAEMARLAKKGVT